MKKKTFVYDKPQNIYQMPYLLRLVTIYLVLPQGSFRINHILFCVTKYINYTQRN